MNRPHIFRHLKVLIAATFDSRRRHVLFLSLLSICILSAVSYAADDKTAAQPEPVVNQTDTGFDYLLENRPDPFMPFITEKAAASKVDMNEIVESSEPLTGMQLFEPGQLTLVALLSAGPEEFAMVEDFTGKGYVINEGTKIGKRGVVKDIRPNEVLIEETAVTRAGKKITNEIVMVLKKKEKEE